MVAYYDPANYLTALDARTTPGASVFSTLEQDYAIQVVANSRIALLKYKFFSAAIWLTLAAVVTLPIAIVVYSIRRLVREG